jgi:hypothetical protein
MLASQVLLHASVYLYSVLEIGCIKWNLAAGSENTRGQSSEAQLLKISVATSSGPGPLLLSNSINAYSQHQTQQTAERKGAVHNINSIWC